MRYARTDCALMCNLSQNTLNIDGFMQAFNDAYKREFGFTIADRSIIVDNIRFDTFIRLFIRTFAEFVELVVVEFVK